MAMTLEVLSATLCVLGLTALGWWLAGRLVRPLSGQGAFVVIPGRGGGEGLEQSVRGFIFLRSLGLLTSTILIADVALDPAGRELALKLCVRWPGVVLWPADHLGEQVELEVRS